jgi:hypothetical protein
VRPDGAVVKGSNARDLGDMKDDDDIDDEEDEDSSTDKWVSRSGTPVSFGLVSLGFWRLWFPLKGDHGRPLFSMAST